MAILLNAGVLSALIFWLQKQRQEPRIGRLLWPLLALKLVVGLLSVYRMSDDAEYFQEWSVLMTQQAWADPQAWVATLGAETFRFQGEALIFHGFSNTFFFIKLLSLLNLMTGGIAWINALYLSLFSFIGCWQLAKVVGQLFPATPPLAAPLAFLAWPSVVFWSAGITKEAVLLGSLAWLAAWVLQKGYGNRPVRWYSVVGGVVLIWLAFKMRFFFAVFLFLALAFLLLIRVLQRMKLQLSNWMQLGLLLVLFAGGAWFAGMISPVFRANKFTSQLIYSYAELEKISQDKPHLHYQNLKPTLGSIASYAPLAALNAVVRPLPGESWELKYVVSGIENLAFISLLLLSVWAVMRGRAGKLPFTVVLAFGFYCFMLAALIGLTTPNLGTLSRYRVAFLPFLVFLLLQNDYVARWLQVPRWLR
ncbi:hypothetical protein [Hymenobacter sp. DG25A]|uniref:hypothetical protein n=1 Tax=Hymenobacter sp. DG25A TaxID=1385663 RepID=UPI001E39C9EF|nr:hypothetical protein [Hymenobacter sp. DG25A]